MENSPNHDNPLGGGGTITSLFCLNFVNSFQFFTYSPKKEGAFNKNLSCDKKGGSPPPPMLNPKEIY